MPKAVVLHIGTRKTGTTSIQEALAAAGDRLGHISYPLFMHDRNQNRLITLYLRHDRLPPHWRQMYPDRGRFEEMRRRYRGFLWDRMASASSAVISGEALSSHLTSLEVGQLRDDLERCGFRSFHVVLYVRDPADFFLSFLQEVLKGTSVTAPVGPHPASFIYDFRRMAQTWETVFPGDVDVHAFPGAGGADVVADFAGLIRRYLGGSLPLAATRANRTISAEAMQIIQDYRLLFSPDNGGYLTPDAARLVQFLQQPAPEVRQNKPVLRTAIAEQIRANHKNDVEFIRSRYGADVRPRSSTPTAESNRCAALNTDQPHRVADLVEIVDPEIVRELLLRFVRAEIDRSAAIPLIRRIAGRVHRVINRVQTMPQ